LIPHTHNWNLWNLKNFKIKNLLNIIKKFQKSFTTCKQGVMYMKSEEKLYFMIEEHNSWNNWHIFRQFEIRITFQNEMQNLVEFVHFKKNLSYS